MIEINNLTENKRLYFEGKTSIEGMKKLVYYLNSSQKRLSETDIKLAANGNFLYLEDGEDVWFTKTNQHG